MSLYIGGDDTMHRPLRVSLVFKHSQVVDPTLKSSVIEIKLSLEDFPCSLDINPGAFIFGMNPLERISSIEKTWDFKVVANISATS
jgi:hypothetical protein